MIRHETKDICTKNIYTIDLGQRGNKKEKKKIEKGSLGLPWWLSGEESTYQCRRYGFDPWPRKLPHEVEQLSL